MGDGGEMGAGSETGARIEIGAGSGTGARGEMGTGVELLPEVLCT